MAGSRARARDGDNQMKGSMASVSHLLANLLSVIPMRFRGAHHLDTAETCPSIAWVIPALDLEVLALETLHKALHAPGVLSRFFAPPLPIRVEISGRHRQVRIQRAVLLDPAFEQVLGRKVVLGRALHRLRHPEIGHVPPGATAVTFVQ